MGRAARMMVAAVVALGALLVLGAEASAQEAQTPPPPQPPLSNADARLTTGVESLSRSTSPGVQHLLIDLMVTAPLRGETTREKKPALVGWFNARFNGAANTSFTGVSQFVGGFQDHLVTGDVASVFNALTFRVGLEAKLPGRVGKGADFFDDYQAQATFIASVGVVSVPRLDKPAIFEISDEARSRWGIPATQPGKDTPIKYVGLTEPDQSRHHLTYEAGLRVKTHHFINCHDRNDACDENRRVQFPGMFDFTLGQDASLTGGTLRGFVAGIEGFYPLPTDNIANTIYFFGRVRRQFWRTDTVSRSPIILKAADASVSIPSDDLWLHTLTRDERSRDDWKVGLGVDLVRFFTLSVGKNAADAQAAAAALVRESGFSRTNLVEGPIGVVRLLAQPGEKADFKHGSDYFLPIGASRLDVLDAKGKIVTSRAFEKDRLEPVLGLAQHYANNTGANFEALLLRIKPGSPESAALDKLDLTGASSAKEEMAPGGSADWQVSTVSCPGACTVKVPASNGNLLVLIPVIPGGSTVSGVSADWKRHVPIQVPRKTAATITAAESTTFVVVRVR